MMDLPKALRQVTFFIVPFGFKKDYREVDTLINHEHWELKKPATDRLFDHIEQLVTDDPENETSIGKRYVFKSQARTKVGLPNRVDAPIHFENGDKKFAFAISSLELYVFETQVGFFVYKIHYPGNIDISQISEANYHLKKLGKVRGTKMYFLKKVSKEEQIEQIIVLDELIQSLVGNLEIETYFEGGSSKGKEAIIYTSLFLDVNRIDCENLICAYLFRLRRGFKDTYKPSPFEFNVNEHADLMQIFENSYWGVSNEGLANIITKTNDETADTFFFTNYFSNIEGTYLYLYILALHQKYALLYLSIQVSHLPNKLKELECNFMEQSNLLEIWRRKLVHFVLRSSYKHVSRLTHHADLYEMIRRRLRIEDLFAELQEELNGLASLTELAEQKQRRHEEDVKRDKAEFFNKGLAYISVFFLPVTVISGLFGMNISLVDKYKNSESVFFGMMGVCYLITILILHRYWIKKQKSR